MPLSRRRPCGTISTVTLKSRNVRMSTAGWRLTGYDAGADDERGHEPEDLLVQVRQRQDGQEAVLQAERQDPHHRCRAAIRLPWLSIALRLAGGAAREDDLREGVASDVGGIDGLGRRAVGQRFDEQDRQPELAGRGLGLATRDHELRVGLADDLAPEVDGVPDVERHGDRTEVGDREERDPHSGRLTAQRMTRSPSPTPASRKTAAAVARSRPRSR